MNLERPFAPGASERALGRAVTRRLVTVVLFLALNGALLFVSAGRLDWTWAWVFLGLSLLSLMINGAVLLRTSPQTIAERGRPGPTPRWDQVAGGLWGLALFAGVPVVAGLDERFGWTGAHPAAWNVAGALLLAVGLGLAGWAMIANAFFSTAVRIQAERGHTVCRRGPYRLVRHPGYLGFICQSLATPVLLGSLGALLPGVAAAAAMIVRTALEDRFLQVHLAGYRDYARDVRFRLCPGVW